MQVWAVVSHDIEQAIELFPTKRKAEEMLALVLEDEPEWRDIMSIERLELGEESPN
jgi:hypothetical protein